MSELEKLEAERSELAEQIEDAQEAIRTGMVQRADAANARYEIEEWKKDLKPLLERIAVLQTSNGGGMTEILGCHFEMKKVKFTEFVDHPTQKLGKTMGHLDCKLDWDSHASKNIVSLILRLTLSALAAQQVVLRVVMKAEYTVQGGETKPKYGDLMGLPWGVWLAIDRHAWSLLEEKN